MVDFYGLYSNIQNLKEICFLILIFTGILAMVFFLDQDKLELPITPLEIVLIIGILEGILGTNKYQINKILNEFYQNNKSIQNFDIKNIDLQK